MDSFASELGLQFPIRMEAPHVIDPAQVLAVTIGKDGAGREITATYKTADTFQFQDELGHLISSICSVSNCFSLKAGFIWTI